MTADEVTKTELSAVLRTDVGIVREHNEDSAYADPEHRFFIVADGMGGHAAGEVASAMAVEAVRAALEGAGDVIEAFAANPTTKGRQQLVQILESAVRDAHKAVFERGIKESDKQGMGTTLDVLLVAGADAFVAHVGDSRTYLVRNGNAAQITTDHTVAEVLVIEGKLSPEEAAASPLRTILVNAIGVAADVGVEMAHLRLKTGDYLLLCSDGLHDYFPIEQEIADHALDQDELDDALVGMVELAKERGGHDNITGILVYVDHAPELSEEAEDAEDDQDAVDTDDEDDQDAVDTDDEDDEDAVPTPVGRDDTIPVDVDEVLQAEAKAKANRDKAALATTAEQEAASEAEAKGDQDDEDSEEDAKRAEEDAKRAKRSELRTTMPIRPFARKPPKKED